MITIDIANPQDVLPIDRRRLRRAVRMVLDGESIDHARISLAIVDDPAIHQLNRRYLTHDEPTDVLSFPLERRDSWLEGEVVASAETAQRASAEFGWTAADELLLYVLHGMLHLVGYDDHSPEQRKQMRSRESIYLARFGLSPRNRRE